MCQSFPGYTARADQNAPGNNLAQYSSLEDAYEACSRDRSCAGFNSIHNSAKSSVASLIDVTGVCLYVKTGT